MSEFLYRLRLYLKLAFRRDRYFADDGHPRRCLFCDCTDVREKTTAMVGWTAAEIEARCHHCKAQVGYWAYGYWDPSYFVLPMARYVVRGIWR